MNSPSDDVKVRNIIEIAGHHKDRLHSLQTTEWNVYYGVLVIILASLYFLLSSSRNLLIDIACGIDEIFGPRIKDINLRILRSVLCFLFSAAFYSAILYFYTSLFYRKNYRSIIESRLSFYYYINCAAKTTGLAHDDKCSPSLDGWEFGRLQRRSSANFRGSEIYMARSFVLKSIVCLSIIATVVISLLSPTREPTVPASVDVSIKK